MLSTVQPPEKKTPSPAALRKRAERARRRDAGMVAVTVYVAEDHRRALRTVAALLTLDGPLARRLHRMLRILEEKLPEKRRARLRAPKLAAEQVRTAETVFLRHARKRKPLP